MLLRLSCFLISPPSSIYDDAVHIVIFGERIHRRKKKKNNIRNWCVTGYCCLMSSRKTSYKKKLCWRQQRRRRRRKINRESNRNETTQIGTSRKLSSIFLGLSDVVATIHTFISNYKILLFRLPQHHRWMCSPLSRKCRIRMVLFSRSLRCIEKKPFFFLSFFLYIFGWNLTRTSTSECGAPFRDVQNLNAYHVRRFERSVRRLRYHFRLSAIQK